MTESRVIENVRLPSAHIEPGVVIEGYVVRGARIDGALMSVNVDPGRRTVVRNVRMEDCRVGRGQVCGAILDEVTVENLANGDVLFIRGAAFRHVTLRGRFDRVAIVSAVAPGIIPERRQRAFEAANRRFYEQVDWALDIREAEFSEVDIHGIPGHLLRLDPESQAVVSREAAVSGAWRSIDLDGTWWDITLEHLSEGRRPAAALVVPTRHPDAHRFYAALGRLREAGIATDPPPRPPREPESSARVRGWLSRSFGRRP